MSLDQEISFLVKEMSLLAVAQISDLDIENKFLLDHFYYLLFINLFLSLIYLFLIWWFDLLFCNIFEDINLILYLDQSSLFNFLNFNTWKNIDLSKKTSEGLLSG